MVSNDKLKVFSKKDLHYGAEKDNVGSPAGGWLAPLFSVANEPKHIPRILDPPGRVKHRYPGVNLDKLK